jgi:hypothetical protein
MRQRSRRYSSGLSGIAVGAEQEVGTGGGVASLVDVGGVRRGVMACGEEACSREEEPGWAMAVIGSDVPGGCVGIGLSPFVSPANDENRVSATCDAEGGDYIISNSSPTTSMALTLEYPQTTPTLPPSCSTVAPSLPNRPPSSPPLHRVLFTKSPSESSRISGRQSSGVSLVNSRNCFGLQGSTDRADTLGLGYGLGLGCANDAQILM